MKNTKTTPTQKLDITLIFDRDHATNSATPNKIAKIKELLNNSAPLYENYILFNGGTAVNIIGATGSRFVIYCFADQLNDIKRKVLTICKGLQVYTSTNADLPTLYDFTTI